MGKLPRFEVIDWLDHGCFSDVRWRHLSEITEDLTPVKVRSIGFILFENKVQIIIAHTLALEDGKISGEMMILKSCITKRRRLK